MIIKRLIIYSYQVKDILKEYKFNTVGLNVIVGEEKEKGQETNGVGKTTMVEAINFLLGGSCPVDFIGKQALAEKDILLILEVRSNDAKPYYLARLINAPQKGYIFPGNKVSFNLSDWIEKEDDDYKNYINDFLVGLKPNEPSFSALREYLIRDEKRGFVDIVLPNRNAANQASYLAFLFGLPYDFEKEIEKYKRELRDYNQKLKVINSLKDEISELKLKEKKLSNEIQELDKLIQKVNISKKLIKDAEGYKAAKTEYNELQNRLFELQHIKEQYQHNIDDLQAKLDQIKVMNDVETFYKQLIGFFPNQIKKNQEQIKRFYNFMVDSRGKYFSHKISEIDYEMDNIKKRIEQLNKVIQRHAKSFKNTDIISDLTKINEDRNLKYEELAQVRVKINMYQEKTNINAKINKIKQEILRQIEMKLDVFNNYKNHISKIKDLFNKLVSIAYGETGVFEIELVNDTSLNAPTGRVKISCTIDDEKSHGRLHMKINMFDLTWLLIGLKNRENLKFLIHDGSYSIPKGSAKFKLLMYIDKELKRMGKGQYFVTINKTELDESEMSMLNKEGCIVARLYRTEDNKERFFGFRYTS